MNMKVGATGKFSAFMGAKMGGPPALLGFCDLAFRPVLRKSRAINFDET